MLARPCAFWVAVRLCGRSNLTAPAAFVAEPSAVRPYSVTMTRPGAPAPPICGVVLLLAAAPLPPAPKPPAGFPAALAVVAASGPPQPNIEFAPLPELAAVCVPRIGPT